MARPNRRLGNLPTDATSFIGRRRDLAELRKKLTAARLVSLVGPGGVGKSRLALRIAADLRRGFPDGAWLIEFAEVRNSALVANAAMAALDLRDQTAAEPLAVVRSYLRDKDLLLVVDNCEHLLDAAAELVSKVITVAPGVRVIATSREPLSVSGEYLVPLAPLELPSERTPESLDQLRQNEGVSPARASVRILLASGDSPAPLPRPCQHASSLIAEPYASTGLRTSWCRCSLARLMPVIRDTGRCSCRGPASRGPRQPILAA